MFVETEIGGARVVFNMYATDGDTGENSRLTYTVLDPLASYYFEVQVYYM